MKKYKLTHLLNDLLTEDVFDTSNMGSSDEPVVDKQTFMAAIAQYHNYARLFSQNIDEYKMVLDNIKFIVDSAEGVTTKETDGWFDNVTVSRHMKEMQSAFKVFEKTIMEAAQINQRLNAAYEDIGKTLQNYYDI